MDIDPAIQSGLLDPIINATISTLRDMAACDAVPRSVARIARWEARSEITASIRLLSNKPGALILDIPIETATALAERLLTEAGIPTNDVLIRDSIGEIANVIGGQAKALTHGTDYTFNLSTPVISGDVRPTDHEVLACYDIEWNSDLGDFRMCICKWIF